jgi:hypothetical protein
MPTMAQRLMEELIRFRQLWSEKKAHSRTPDNLANLNLGLRMWLEFAQGTLERSRPKRRSWIERRGRIRAGGSRAGRHPGARRSRKAIPRPDRGSLRIRTGTPPIPGWQLPPRAVKWGWTFAAGDWRPQGDCIGWVDDEAVYLQWKAAFAVAQQIGRDVGEQIQVTINTLGKRLRQAGVLRPAMTTREDQLCQKEDPGVYHKVWKISPEGLYLQKKTDITDIGSEPETVHHVKSKKN